MTPATWLAHFRDGTTLAQYQDGCEHSLHHVDRPNLVALTLIAGTEPVLTMKREAGEPFFYRRRTAMTPGGGARVCHLIGKLVADKWLMLGFLEHNNEFLQSWGFQPGWLASPEFLPDELAEQSDLVTGPALVV